MTSDDIFQWIRVFNTVWASLLFVALIYWGTLDILLGNRCPHEHVTKEHKMWATTALAGLVTFLISVVEIFLTDVAGGWRVLAILPFLYLCTRTMLMGAKRVQQHRRDVEQGKCL